MYRLLLGEHFGEPLPDTGKAPTEEEFTVAKRRGIPILVFRKTGIDPDERQRDFIARAGDYQHGRFWKEFGDNGQLAVVVLQALREVAAEAAPLRWEPVDAEPAVRWRAGRSILKDRSETYIPVLEVHLAALAAQPVLPVSALQPLASSLGRAGRDAGLFSQAASVGLGSDSGTAWASSPGDQLRGSWDQVSLDGPSGVAIDRNGGVLVFKPLARDMLGTVVNGASLARELEPLLRLGHEVLPPRMVEFAPAAGLGPIDRVMEGDPSEVGHRSSGGMRMSGSKPVRTVPDVKVAVAAWPRAIPEIAHELAARITAELRTRRSAQRRECAGEADI